MLLTSINITYAGYFLYSTLPWSVYQYLLYLLIAEKAALTKKANQNISKRIFGFLIIC